MRSYRQPRQFSQIIVVPKNTRTQQDENEHEKCVAKYQT